MEYIALLLSLNVGGNVVFPIEGHLTYPYKAFRFKFLRQIHTESKASFGIML